MSTVATSKDSVLQSVSKRYVVADVADRLKTMQEEEANRLKSMQEEEDKMIRERDDFHSLQDIADYCDLKFLQEVDPNGNDIYILLKKNSHRMVKSPWGTDQFSVAKKFQTLDEAKRYLLNHKSQLDRMVDQSGDIADFNTRMFGM